MCFSGECNNEDPTGNCTLPIGKEKCYESVIDTSPGGVIGSLKGLKNPRLQGHVGSSPSLGILITF
jgi:hypothetical protein